MVHLLKAMAAVDVSGMRHPLLIDGQYHDHSHPLREGFGVDIQDVRT